MKTNSKLSIVITLSKNEKNIDRCISSVLNQTYKDLEIIIINNGLINECDSIINDYMNKDNRIKYIKYKNSKGLFQARLIGANRATGDYIAFLDKDDYVSVDYYRSLMNNALNTESDIIVGHTLIENSKGKLFEKPLLNFNFKELNGEEILNKYFEQKGLNYLWYTLRNKIYSINIWKEAISNFDEQKKLDSNDEFIYSSVLFYYAKKMTVVENDYVVYGYKDEINSAEEEKVTINDIYNSCSFVEDFLKKNKIDNNCRKNYIEWKKLICTKHRDIINSIENIDDQGKNELLKNLIKISKEYLKNKNYDYFNSVDTEYDNRLEELKKNIIDEKIKCVSFDIFDTLVTRPFYIPLDLFRLLDNLFNKESGKQSINFSKMRVESEKRAREKKELVPDLEEVTLDEIYDTMHEVYCLDKTILNKMKKAEIDLEIRFCQRRNTAHELYQLANYLDKKVICISDMYLPIDTIRKIINNCGYDIKDIYLSSDLMKTKATGSLFEYALSKEELEPGQVLHIGDNHETDYLNPQKIGMNSAHFIKTKEAMENAGNMVKMLTGHLPFWQDTACSMKFLGVRTMLAVVANKYFDNPFKSFNKKTDFNADPYLIGYYALGMYNYGITKWLLDNTNDKYDTLAFMARDGYLSMNTYEILKPLYSNPAKSEYLYFSRKASLPLLIKEKFDFYKMSDITNYSKSNPKKMFSYLGGVLDIGQDDIRQLCADNNIKYNQDFKTITEFNNFITIVVNKFFDEKKNNEKRAKLKKYFDGILKDKCAIFDVGYSGRPEFYLGKLLNKKIDTLFLNINSDEAEEYSAMGNYELKTFFSAKPTLTGNAYELLLSKIAPSCIEFDTSKEDVVPMFEAFENDYLIYHNVEVIQNAAIEFTKDLYSIFKDDIKSLYYQDYYLTMPIMSYINSGQKLDKQVLRSIVFEDDIGRGCSRNMVDDMELDANSKNQRELVELFEGRVEKAPKYVLVVPKYIENTKDLPKHRISRIVYYTLFDRPALKKKMKNFKNRIRRK